MFFNKKEDYDNKSTEMLSDGTQDYIDENVIQLFNDVYEIQEVVEKLHDDGMSREMAISLINLAIKNRANKIAEGVGNESIRVNKINTIHNILD